MKVYKSQQEVERDIHNGVLQADDDIRFECDIDIDARIDAWNIKAENITARDIKVRNIKAQDITAQDITARDIKAENIIAWDIKAQDIITENIKTWDITAENIIAWDITAWNIKARDIKARDISYYAICGVYGNIRCRSIEGRRRNAHHFCLDGDIKD